MLKTKFIFILLLLAGIAVLLPGCGKKITINLNDYVTVTYSGYNYIGTAEASFDFERLVADFENKINPKKDVQLNEDGVVATLFDSCVSMSLDKTDTLSNGNTINMTFKCRTQAAKDQFGVDIVFEDTKYTVTGLTEANDFNPFDYITVSFTGKTPDCKTQITPNEIVSEDRTSQGIREELQYLSLTCNKETGLSFGDTVTVSARYAEGVTERDFITMFGEKLSADKQAYTVSEITNPALTVSLNKYLLFSTSGCDGMGFASVDFDTAAFLKDYEKKIQEKVKGDEVEDISDAQTLLDVCVSYYLDRTEKLSNNNVLTLHWNCNDKWALEKYNCVLSYKDVQFVVDDLPKAEKLDPFTLINVSFAGVEPTGYIVIRPAGEYPELDYIKFTPDRDGVLSLDEEVVLTAELICEDDIFAEKFGSILGTTEKTYVVEASY